MILQKLVGHAVIMALAFAWFLEESVPALSSVAPAFTVSFHLGQGTKTHSYKNDELNIEIEVKTISSFLNSAKSCDTNVVDMLHTPKEFWIGWAQSTGTSASPGTPARDRGAPRGRRDRAALYIANIAATLDAGIRGRIVLEVPHEDDVPSAARASPVLARPGAR